MRLGLSAQGKSDLEMSLLQKYVGFLIIGDMKVACRKKPKPFHLWMMRIFFGWTWQEK
jgi:hypothetical protein